MYGVVDMGRSKQKWNEALTEVLADLSSGLDDTDSLRI